MGTLLFQLIPYLLVAVLAVWAVGRDVYQASQSRRRRMRLMKANLAHRQGPGGAVRSAPAGESPTVTGPQIQRLHEFGVTPQQIASALRLPLEEVDLVVRIMQMRRAPEPAAQLS
jgi:hypothetical protein